MQARRRIVTSIAASAALLGLACLPAQAYADGGGSVGYCASNHVYLSTRSTVGAVAHSWSAKTYTWYNSSTTTRTSSRNLPYDTYGYAVDGTLISLSTSCG